MFLIDAHATSTNRFSTSHSFYRFSSEAQPGFDIDTGPSGCYKQVFIFAATAVEGDLFYA